MTNIFKNIYVGLHAETAIALLHQHAFATGVAIILSADKAVLKKLYQVISTLPVHKTFTFCFSLPAGVALASEDMDAIGRFLFLANYYTPNKHAPFLISEDRASGGVLHALQQWCQQQGFNEPDVVTPAPGGNSKATIISVDEQDAYLASLPGKVQGMACWWQPVVFKVADLAEVQSLEKKINDFEERLQKENFQLYSLLATVIQLQEEKAQHAFRMQYMEQQVNNLKQFNDLIRSTNEVEKILTFYHTQYEALPLWYKRFGHIIKMLMGKRDIPFISNKKQH